MFTRRKSNTPDKSSETAYREFYLKADVNQARWATALFTIPLIGFVFNDYRFFGVSYVFFGLVSIRFTLLAVASLVFKNLGKVKSFHTYDRILFAAIFAIMVGGGIINATRPSSFLVSSVITIVSIFVLYLVVPLKLQYQIFLASLTTIGESIIIVVLSNAETSAVFTLLFTMFVANIISSFSSWQLHSYRKRTYEEFAKRKALQDELEKHANQLSSLVEERTNDLIEAQSRLVQSERFAAIGELAGMVGHDLRNPLAAMRNSTYYIKKKYGSSMNETGNQMLSVINRSIDHADNILKDLLDYSREMVLELQESSPKSLVDYSLSTMSSFISHNQINVLNNTQTSPTFLVDASRMERVFMNLIKNAVEAMPEGGTLKIDSRGNEEYVEFVFADTGKGIPKETLDRLFKPLFTTKAQGMGFGLAICKRIVETHHGEISVESVLDKGTSFTVKLPLDPKIRKGGGTTIAV